MSFSKALAGRLGDLLAGTRGIEEKRMFGGLCFLLHGHILVGVWKSSLIVRLGPEQTSAALRRPGVREFDVTGRPMTGWVLVDPEATDDDDALRDWIAQATAWVTTLPAK